jgi:bacterioferritin-associated ferredoxin
VHRFSVSGSRPVAPASIDKKIRNSITSAHVMKSIHFHNGLVILCEAQQRARVYVYANKSRKTREALEAFCTVKSNAGLCFRYMRKFILLKSILQKWTVKGGLKSTD